MVKKMNHIPMEFSRTSINIFNHIHAGPSNEGPVDVLDHVPRDESSRAMKPFSSKEKDYAKQWETMFIIIHT